MYSFPLPVLVVSDDTDDEDVDELADEPDDDIFLNISEGSTPADDELDVAAFTD